MEKINIVRADPSKNEKMLDAVTEEVPLTIYVNDEEIVTLLASPRDLEELAVGFLFTSALISGYDEISGITVDTGNWAVYVELKDRDIETRLLFKRMFTSGCGRGTLFYNAADVMHSGKRYSEITIDRKGVFRMMKDFQVRSSEFMETGGVHSAALADTENILMVKEDIGRHNAIDKIVGSALMGGTGLKGKVIFTSGRISSEILLKIQKTDIPVIISRSAPTNQAVKHAERSDITLIGFVRGERMNIYNGEKRII